MGQQVEREPYNLLFGQRKGPDGRKVRPRSGERREGYGELQEPAGAVAAGGHGHVAADEEGQAAEHLLLGQAGLVGYQLADAIGKSLVVSHRVRVRHVTRGDEPQPACRALALTFRSAWSRTVEAGAWD